MTTDVDLAELQPLAVIIAEKLRTVPVHLIGRGGADDLISELTIASALYCSKHILPAGPPPAPDPAETGEERADREETEGAHAHGDHTYCGATCEIEFPSESMRNAILARAIPGSKGMLDELLRRARAEAAASSAPAEQPSIQAVMGPADGQQKLRLLDRLYANTTPVEAPTDRAAVLREAADDWTAHCPDHSDAEDTFMDCPCDWAAELHRKAEELEAQQP